MTIFSFYFLLYERRKTPASLVGQVENNESGSGLLQTFSELIHDSISVFFFTNINI